MTFGSEQPRSADTRRETRPLWGRPLRLDHLVPDRITDQVRHRIKVQLPQDTGPMVLSGPNTDLQRLCHFFVAFAFSKKLHNLAFARAEGLALFSFGTVEKIRKQNLGNSRS